MSTTDLNVDIVGREFVRQYYTVLNQRPDCLHLFFTQDSSLVHGGIEKPGEEEPAYKGQSAIRQKIVSLGFVDCHTKICQVDCQQTIGNAVLVQVSGELSNNGEPMRRFMQSFILVQQAPKKFYVHNDIFRYQDEVFGDCLSDQAASLASQSTHINGDERLAVEDLNNHVDGLIKHELTNGDHMDLEEKNETSIGMRSSQASECEQVTVTVPPIESSESNFEKVNCVKTVETMPILDPKIERSIVGLQQKDECIEHNSEPRIEPLSQVQQSSRTFSWATMASKNAAGTSAALITSPIQGPPKPQATIRPERKSDATYGVGNSHDALPQRNNNRNRQEQQGVENDRKWGGGGGGESMPLEPERGSGEPNEDIPGKPIPDDQQLFVGNLPQMTTEMELVELFEKFGKVLEVKINRRGSSRDLPNFGFVFFDSHDAVVRALKEGKSLVLNKRRINIELKKDLSELTSRNRMGPPRGRGGGGFNRASFPNNRRNIDTEKRD